MGDPRHISAKTAGPGHPWNKERIEREQTIIRDYGLKNKRELWKFQTQVKSFTGQAKKLIAAIGTQAELERKQLLERLQRLGLTSAGAKLDDVLGLTVTHLLNRRLQTQVHKKGLARSPKQARQFITHAHVAVNGKTITSPSYIVSVAEEAAISVVPSSTLSNVSHPERVPITKKPKKRRPEPRRGERRRQ